MGGSWDNGYLALGALDDDGDGRLAGVELRGLSLWRDANRDDASGDGEVLPVAAYDIVALDYAHMRAGEDLWVSYRGDLCEWRRRWRPDRRFVSGEGS